MRKVVIVLSLIFLQIQIIIAAKPDDVVGKWRTANGKGIIEIYKSKNGTFEGKVLGGEPRKDKNGNPILTDINNPDPTKRNQTTKGLIILTKFVFDDDEWIDGNVYNPEDGKDYSCKIWMDDYNNLNLRGYLGISLLGRTEKWTRITN
jgi:uncharacterized protein (DUF2147 family)